MRVAALGDTGVAFGVEFVVDLQPLVGHPDPRRFGQCKQPTSRQQYLPVGCRADLAPDVTGWLSDPNQERLDPRPEGIHVLDSLPLPPAGDSDGVEPAEPTHPPIGTCACARSARVP